MLLHSLLYGQKNKPKEKQEVVSVKPDTHADILCVVFPFLQGHLIIINGSLTQPSAPFH